MRLFCFLLSVWCILAACNRPQTDLSAADFEAEEPASGTVVAQVGPESITQVQVEQRLRQLDQEDFNFASSSTGQRNFLQLLVREKLAALDAKAHGLDKSDEYLTALEDKREELHALYQTYAQQLLLHLWEDYLQESGTLQITDEEIESYYKKYPYEMKIKQIILPDAQTADDVWRELKHNKNRWKELERRYSIAPQRSHGQEITFMPGEFMSELEDIAANSPTGSVQGFVKTTQGFHIIMKTGERRLSLKDAAPRIRSVLENQKLDTLLQDLQTKYKVVFYEQNN